VPVADAGVAETVARIAEQRDASAVVVDGLGRLQASPPRLDDQRLPRDGHRPVLVVRAQ
jgi:hypothetical protein